MVNDTDPRVRAIRAGRVIASNDYGAWGKHICIKHEDGLYCVYAHMGNRYYQTGDWVEEGDIIGIMGSTGNVTAGHLHIELATAYYDAHAHVNIADYLGLNNERGLAEYLP